MRHYIRGVGSGLPLVREYLDISGGSLSIEDNLGSGAVITIRTGAPRPTAAGSATAAYSTDPLLPRQEDIKPVPRLTSRQKRVLALVMEAGSAGPSIVHRELSVGVSTAHRDLATLEALGLLVSSDGGQRELTDAGRELLEQLLSQ
jgi:hypothetical protein